MTWLSLMKVELAVDGLKLFPRFPSPFPLLVLSFFLPCICSWELLSFHCFHYACVFLSCTIVVTTFWNVSIGLYAFVSMMYQSTLVTMLCFKATLVYVRSNAFLGIINLDLGMFIVQMSNTVILLILIYQYAVLPRLCIFLLLVLHAGDRVS